MNECHSVVLLIYSSGGQDEELKFQSRTFSLLTQLVITCLKLAIETLEQGVKYVQS